MPKDSPVPPKPGGDRKEGGRGSMEAEEVAVREANLEAANRCLSAACHVLDFDIAELWSFSGDCLHVFGMPATIESCAAGIAGVWSEKTRDTRHSLSPDLCRAAAEDGKPVWITSADAGTPLHDEIPLNTAVALPISSEHLRKDVVAIFFSCSEVPRSKVATELLRHLSRAAVVACSAAFPAEDCVASRNEAQAAGLGISPWGSMPGSPRLSPPVLLSPPVKAGAGGSALQPEKNNSAAAGAAPHSRIVEEPVPLAEEADGAMVVPMDPATAKTIGAAAAKTVGSAAAGAAELARQTPPQQQQKQQQPAGDAATGETKEKVVRIVGGSSTADEVGNEVAALPPQKRDLGGSGHSGPARRRSSVDYASLPLDLEVTWAELKDLEFLVNGSRCTIYTARYRGVNVVVKLLNKGVQDAQVVRGELELEMKLLKQLQHRNIVRLVGAGTVPERFLLIERLDGGTLAQRCGNALAIRDRRGRFRRAVPFTYVELLRCGRQLAEALRYMHDSAIPGCIVMHRDLKPDNVAFDVLPDGSLMLKLIDLGLAKVVTRVNGNDENQGYNLTGETGSLRYMAPEVARNEPYNEKADVYGFAMILWEMATMKKPFEGLGREAFFELVVNDVLRPPCSKKWPKAFTELLQTCWNPDPRQRARLCDVSERLKMMIKEVEITTVGGSGTRDKRSRLAKFFRGDSDSR